MRVYAISDLHVDYAGNRRWLDNLSQQDYQDDALIVAGDISDDITELQRAFVTLTGRFRAVMFVPGNHDLWVANCTLPCSLEKFDVILAMAGDCGVQVGVHACGGITFVPMFAWYDHSFAAPDRYLLRAWRDYRACRWPDTLADSAAVNRFFLSLNEAVLGTRNEVVISFSHFVPRIDLMPASIPQHRRRVYPVLGSHDLGRQVAQLKPDLHVYGHSHVNRDVVKDGIRYVNNAFGSPSESRIARKQLFCIHDPADTGADHPELRGKVLQ